MRNSMSMFCASFWWKAQFRFENANNWRAITRLDAVVPVTKACGDFMGRAMEYRRRRSEPLRLAAFGRWKARFRLCDGSKTRTVPGPREQRGLMWVQLKTNGLKLSVAERRLLNAKGCPSSMQRHLPSPITPRLCTVMLWKASMFTDFYE